MAIPKAQPVRFSPKGLSDSYDSSEAFQGACRSLSNLIFDQQNPELVVCRPGVTQLTTFSGFTTPTFISIHITIGSMVYGMVSTARNAGHDEPFAYSIATNTFTTISGVLNTNTPTSPASTGVWNPPSMTVVGTKIIVTHPGFIGTGILFFGVIDISNPVAPAWSSTNTTTNTLPSAPTWVANLNNRAYYACGNVLYYSDALNPTVMTNAGQSLTLGDTTPIRCAVGLPIQTTSAGVAQSLMAFKDFQVWQITGDSALSTLSLNFLSLNVGTSAPRSVVQTPYGVHFMAIDGPYIVDPLGLVRPLTKEQKVSDQDIQAPFIYATTPSRVAAGYSGGIYRTCLDTTSGGTLATNDYWFDTQRRRWNGPHSFPFDCASQAGNYFVISHGSKGAILYKSQLFQDSSSVYLDDGVQMTFNFETSTFPKDGSMSEKQVVESTVELASSGGNVAYSISALDERHNVINTTSIIVSSTNTLWGNTTWGGGKWSATLNVPSVYTIPWTAPLVFQKMALSITGQSKNNISIGAFFARSQMTGYLNREN